MNSTYTASFRRPCRHVELCFSAVLSYSAKSFGKKTVDIAALFFIGIFPSFAQGVPTAYTLDWRRYFPLEIGNEWHYESYGSEEQYYYRRTVVGDTLINGVPYFVYRHEAFDANSQQFGVSIFYLRYSVKAAHIVHVIKQPDGTFSEDRWWSFLICGLDAPFNAGELHPCGGEVEDVHVQAYGGYGGRIVLGIDTVEVAALKAFDLNLGGEIFEGGEFAADIGPLGIGGSDSNAGSVIVYAKVGVHTIGSPIVPTEVEEPILIPHTLLILSLYPNPVRDVAFVAFSLGETQHLRLSIFNALGQRIYEEDIGTKIPGTHLVTLEPFLMTASASGVYFLRLSTPTGVSATRSFVRSH